MADGDVAARPGRGRSFWILVVLLAALLIAAIVAGLMWSAENQRSAELERQNSELMQERTANEAS